MRSCPKEIAPSDQSRQDRRYLALALALASTSGCSNRHGAVLVKGGRVLATGVNRFRNHPASMSPEHVRECSVHAEEDALRKAGAAARGARLYVARSNKSGEPAPSRPCPQCLGRIVRAGVAKVVHT